MMHNMCQGHLASYIYLQNNIRNQVLSAGKGSDDMSAFDSQDDDMDEKGFIGLNNNMYETKLARL